MKRTTVFLPDELHERLRREAFQSRVSMAELIRRRLEGRHRRRNTGKPFRDPLDEVIGTVHAEGLSERIDEELYGS
jgi:hypothetical protein